MSPILDLQRRLHEAGRIRIGEKVPLGGGKSRPAKLGTFRFTSRNEAILAYVAQRYGGEVRPWADAPTDQQYELITESTELRVMVPPEDMGFSQFYELWKAGGCERRCDGFRLLGSEAPCMCDAEARDCKPHTRLSVMLADMPTSGLWRLDTSGQYAAAELGGAFELAKIISTYGGRSVLGATLRLEQRQTKRPDKNGKTVTRNFAVPVLEWDINPAHLVGEAPGPVDRFAAVTPVPALPAPSFAEQLKAIESPAEGPKRRNSAPELKPTGVSVRAIAPTAEVDEIVNYFAALGGDDRWEVLRANGWQGAGRTPRELRTWLASLGETAALERIFEGLIALGGRA